MLFHAIQMKHTLGPLLFGLFPMSGFKSMMKDVEETKKEALESVPQIASEQIPSREETADVLLEGSTEDKKKARENI